MYPLSLNRSVTHNDLYTCMHVTVTIGLNILDHINAFLSEWNSCSLNRFLN